MKKEIGISGYCIIVYDLNSAVKYVVIGDDNRMNGMDWFATIHSIQELEKLIEKLQTIQREWEEQ